MARSPLDYLAFLPRNNKYNTTSAITPINDGPASCMFPTGSHPNSLLLINNWTITPKHKKVSPNEINSTSRFCNVLKKLFMINCVMVKVIKIALQNAGLF